MKCVELSIPMWSWLLLVSHSVRAKDQPQKWWDNDWLLVDLPLWKMMDFVSWDDDIYIYIYICIYIYVYIYICMYIYIYGSMKFMLQTTNQMKSTIFRCPTVSWHHHTSALGQSRVSGDITSRENRQTPHSHNMEKSGSIDKSITFLGDFPINCWTHHLNRCRPTCAALKVRPPSALTMSITVCAATSFTLKHWRSWGQTWPRYFANLADKCW